MTRLLPKGVRVGGAALPDGVMMLTPVAVAIARECGDGTLSIEAFPLPERKLHMVEKLPFVRIVPKLVHQMSFVIRGWKLKTSRPLPVSLLAAIVIMATASMGVNALLVRAPAIWHAVGSSLLQLGLFFGLIGVTRALPKFGRIWRFHGGEHQAIAAYEAGMDLTVENATTRTLYHPRCGTNLATLAMMLMVPGMAVGTLLSGIAGYIVTLAVPLLAMCIAFEVVMLGQKRLRAVLWPGLLLQRLTVAMPARAESLAGLAALKAALTEHARVQAAREKLAASLPTASLVQSGAQPPNKFLSPNASPRVLPAFVSNSGVGFGDKVCYFRPIGVAVETHTQPAPMTDVGRHEKAIGITGDENILSPRRCSAPEGQAVVVMVVGIGGVHPTTDEPGRLPVAEPFCCLRKR